jgi:hypothetical protein
MALDYATQVLKENEARAIAGAKEREAIEGREIVESHPGARAYVASLHARIADLEARVAETQA